MEWWLQPISAHEVKHQHDHQRNHRGGHLIFRHGRYEQADGQKARAQQEEARQRAVGRITEA